MSLALPDDGPRLRNTTAMLRTRIVVTWSLRWACTPALASLCPDLIVHQPPHEHGQAPACSHARLAYHVGIQASSARDSKQVPSGVASDGARAASTRALRISPRRSSDASTRSCVYSSSAESTRLNSTRRRRGCRYRSSQPLSATTTRLLYRRDDGSLAFTAVYANEDQVPRYAILSHTWLAESEEVTYDALATGRVAHATGGWKKIQFCADQAAKDGLKFFWVDTCCINKSSSQELQETITTMFQCYRAATRCYVYLADVSVEDEAAAGDVRLGPWKTAFQNSRWFTRGWTLQELLAPKSVEFFTMHGTRLGDKASLETEIHQRTAIPRQALRSAEMHRFSVDERLSWASGRNTSRKEDKAYSLLGIFGVFMPLMYGEGDHAFARLRKVIDADHTATYQLLTQLPVAHQAAFNSLDNQHGPTCLPETRVELLQDIARWANGDERPSILWLNGIAGTGKSTIARTVARTHYDRGDLGASFFFSRRSGHIGCADTLFTTLASQMGTNIPALRRYISETILEAPNIAAHSLRDQWDKLILEPLEKLDRTSDARFIMIVIDALDECESERDIRVVLRLLATNSMLKNIKLRIFLKSRPELAIRSSFSQILETQRQSFELYNIAPSIVVKCCVST